MVKPFLAPLLSKVLAVKRENHDTVTLTLTLPDDCRNWRPGQFNMLYLFGHGEIPVSISGEVSSTPTMMHTVKAVGSVSQAIAGLQPGDELWIRGPFGTPWPETGAADDGRDLIFVGGGIGLAPLRPAITYALEKKQKGRVIVLVGARTPADLIFADDLKKWSKNPRATVMVTVDRIEGKENSLDSPWEGEVGVVTNLLPYAGIDPAAAARTMALTCGPEVMMRFVAGDLMRMGMDPSNIYVSAERNMKCAVGMCGRCQWGPHFICRDGPVYSWEKVRKLWIVKEF